MSSLKVDFLGISFDHPLVLASAPPTANAEMISRAFDVGWAGAVIKTIISEPVVNLESRFASQRLGAELMAFQNIELLSETTPDKWYEEIALVKKRFPEKVLIASVMGDARRKKAWLDLAFGCQQAGADLLELNFSCPHGYPEKGKGAAIGQSATYAARITRWLKKDPRIAIPIVPKLTAAVTDISHVGRAVAEAGAEGLCAINTFPAFMGFDSRTLQPRMSVDGYSTTGGYSGPGIKPIALRCVYDLVRDPGLPVMAGGGVFSGEDALDFLLLGAPIVQVGTAVMVGGYGIVKKMHRQLAAAMERHGFEQTSDLLGAGLAKIRRHDQLSRDFTVRPRIDSRKCTGCGACFIACRDGGFQAIAMKRKLAEINLDKCRGCSLCRHVCPSGALSLKSFSPGKVHG